MEKGKIWRWMGGWGLILVAASVLIGYPSLAGAQQFAGEIAIGDDEEFTGAYAATTYAQAKAAGDFWKYHNSQITVGGKTYKIKHLLVDNKTDVSLSVSNFNRFLAEGAVIVRTDWTPGMISLKPLGEKNKIPIFGGGFSKDAFHPPSKYLYGFQPSYPGALCGGVKWYKEKVWKGPGKMKVGLLLWDSAYGRSSHLDSVYDYLKQDLGVEVLPTQFFPVAGKDLTPQLARFKEQGANLIYQQALAAQYAIMARDAKRLGMTPQVGLMATFWCISDKYLELAKDAAEGTYGVWQWYIDPSEDSPKYPEVQKLRSAMEKYQGTRFFDVNYFNGWVPHHIIKHALEMTIQKYGFPITGEQVAETLSTMPAWDWGLSRSFSGYAGGDRLGWHEVRAYQVKSGKIVLVSDWLPEPAEFLKREPWITGGGK